MLLFVVTSCAQPDDMPKRFGCILSPEVQNCSLGKPIKNIVRVEESTFVIDMAPAYVIAINFETGNWAAANKSDSFRCTGTFQVKQLTTL